MHPRSLTTAHPWHGISTGDKAPDIVNVFVEVVPDDRVKYEIDKTSGHLKVDRPQKYSNLCPSLYGFIPQTLCADQVAAFAAEKTGKSDVKGDNDPMDICVLTERPINHGFVLLRARPIGGFRMFDGGEADDKIIAVLMNDPAYGAYHDISEVPVGIIDRLRHYFMTYKQIPDNLENTPQTCTITHVYDHNEAKEAIRRSISDYQKKYLL
jgi:inorganic pyrophosphatase